MKTIVRSQLPVLALEIDEEGTVAQKSMQMTRQGQLENGRRLDLAHRILRSRQ